VGIAGFSALMTDFISRLRSERQDAQASRAVAVPA
jgi:hypothetical protein